MNFQSIGSYKISREAQKWINDNIIYRFAYQGQFAEKDQETGFNAFELRLYDSRIGRWMVPDPYGQYWSTYKAMGNNPIRYIDPNGGISGDPVKTVYSKGNITSKTFMLPDVPVVASRLAKGTTRSMKLGALNTALKTINPLYNALSNLPVIDGGNVGKQPGGLTVSTAFSSGVNGPMNNATAEDGWSGYLNWDLLSWVRPSAGKLNVDRVPWDSNIRDVVYKTSIIVKTYPSSSPAPAIAPPRNVAPSSQSESAHKRIITPAGSEIDTMLYWFNGSDTADVYVRHNNESINPSFHNTSIKHVDGQFIK